MKIPIMLDLPEQFLTLQTPRLILRKLELADAEDIFAYASDPQVTAHTSWTTHQSIDDTYEYLRNFVFELYRSDKGMDWGIVEKASGKLIGTCGLYTNPTHRRAELGYTLSRAYWGQGLQRVQAICNVENVASARVLEKSGMQFEGILHNYLFDKERAWDVKMYAITRSHTPLF
jgi:[ribosomal protein S5]-alanine N-acetyltransferase